MAIWVTGATGYVGTHLVELLARSRRVVALTRRLVEDRDNVVRVAWDLAQGNPGDACTESVDAFVALAQSRAYRDFPAGAADVFNVNVAATLRAMQWARARNCRRFVLASSANVYPFRDYLISEGEAVQPTTFYARSKCMAELIAESFASEMACTVLRFFTIFGPNQRDALMPTLIERVRSETEIDLDGPQGMRLSPVHVDDACTAIVAALEGGTEPSFRVFNVGGAEATSVRGLGELIGRALGRTPRLRCLSNQEKGGWMASIARARETLGWQPKIGLEVGINKLLTNA